jgi:hypothetical protein
MDYSVGRSGYKKQCFRHSFTAFVNVFEERYSQGHVSLRSSCIVQLGGTCGLARICIKEDLPGRDLASVPNKFALTTDPRLVAGHQLRIPILLTLFSPAAAVLNPYI